jgi:hypothetical protein
VLRKRFCVGDVCWFGRRFSDFGARFERLGTADLKVEPVLPNVTLGQFGASATAKRLPRNAVKLSFVVRFGLTFWQSTLDLLRSLFK